MKDPTLAIIGVGPIGNTCIEAMHSKGCDAVLVGNQEVKPFVITNPNPISETLIDFKYTAPKRRNTNFTKPKKKRKK